MLAQVAPNWVRTSGTLKCVESWQAASPDQGPEPAMLAQVAPNWVRTSGTLKCVESWQAASPDKGPEPAMLARVAPNWVRTIRKLKTPRLRIPRSPFLKIKIGFERAGSRKARTWMTPKICRREGDGGKVRHFEALDADAAN